MTPARVGAGLQRDDTRRETTTGLGLTKFVVDNSNSLTVVGAITGGVPGTVIPGTATVAGGVPGNIFGIPAASPRVVTTFTFDADTSLDVNFNPLKTSALVLDTGTGGTGLTFSTINTFFLGGVSTQVKPGG